MAQHAEANYKGLCRDLEAGYTQRFEGNELVGEDGAALEALLRMIEPGDEYDRRYVEND